VTADRSARRSPDATSCIVLVQASPRTAPGVLTWAAWEALRKAATVRVRHLAPQWATALADAGVEVLETEPAGAGTWFDHRDDTELATALAETAVREGAELEVVMGSYDLPGSRVLDLVATMDRLRSPGGCPWDARQTHESLLRYLVEEAYEVVEAVESGSREDLREELGDLLLQVVFHARLAREDAEDPFDVDDVAAGIVDKLVRRHPHVFGGGDGGEPSPEHADVRTAEDVEARWERNKAVEKGRVSALDGIPGGLPALARAEKVLDRLHRHGVEAPLPAASDVGTRLLHDVAAARAAGTSAEEALRRALRDWETQLRVAENRASEPPRT
jgi:XTP/dITP diphosphohydrolase